MGQNWPTKPPINDTAGQFARRGFVVQITGPFTGKENCGVSQSWKFIELNDKLKEGAEDYFKTKPIKPGTVVNGPWLNSDDPFDFPKGWIPRYKDGVMSFADVIFMKQDTKGSAEITTCFYSKAKACKYEKCCVTWTWTLDVVGTNKIHKVEEKESKCYERK